MLTNGFPERLAFLLYKAFIVIQIYLVTLDHCQRHIAVMKVLGNNLFLYNVKKVRFSSQHRRIKLSLNTYVPQLIRRSILIQLRIITHRPENLFRAPGGRFMQNKIINVWSK